VETAFRPVKTLSFVFKKPKDRLLKNQVTGIVYKVKCKPCSFVYNWGEQKGVGLPGGGGGGEKAGTRGKKDAGIGV